MIERTYFVLLNLDAFSAEMAGLDSTEERGQWLEGFQVGSHGHTLRFSWSEIKMAGYHFGAASLAEAEAHREKKVQAGKRSAQIRKDMKGSAQPERCSNDARTAFGGCSEQTPEHHPEQTVEQTPNQPVTSNHEPTTNIQDPITKKERRAKFVPPTHEEAMAYAKEIGFTRWETWMDHYKANGWMTGKVKMVDWHACMDKWNREGTLQTNQKPQRKGVQFNGFATTDYTAGLDEYNK